MNAPRALIRGLRRPGYEPQLTTALASIFAADQKLAADFRLLLVTLGKDDLADELPPTLDCVAEEVVPAGRLDLRLRSGPSWDLILELKIHAGYGGDWFERYVREVDGVKHGYVAAVTRDVPQWGEPPAGVHPKWLGSTRWRALLAGMRRLEPSDPLLRMQWPLFLDVLEEEGSMGFTQPDPALFDAYGRTKLALDHMEEFVRAIQTPLLQALRQALGGDEDAAGLYWKSGRRLGRTRWGRISIPFRAPASERPWRVRAGVISWQPPASFFVQLAPDQRWDRRVFSPEVRTAVDELTRREFEPKWMAAYLPFDDSLVSSTKLEERVVEWAHHRFADLVNSGVLSVRIDALGNATAPDGEPAPEDELLDA